MKWDESLERQAAILYALCLRPAVSCSNILYIATGKKGKSGNATVLINNAISGRKHNENWNREWIKHLKGKDEIELRAKSRSIRDVTANRLATEVHFAKRYEWRDKYGNI